MQFGSPEAKQKLLNERIESLRKRSEEKANK
jgi:hypothetical protein